MFAGNRDLARYILSWIRDRNGGELLDVFDDMKVGDARRMQEELQAILLHEGRPPNWVV